jgi:hypothetical protein
MFKAFFGKFYNFGKFFASGLDRKNRTKPAGFQRTDARDYLLPEQQGGSFVAGDG